MKPAETGHLGEEAVCRWLEEQGYHIQVRNFRIRGGEIDIVADKGDELCFIEVKTRKPDAQESGFEAVDRRKQRLLIRAAYAYCEKYAISDEDWYIRYDIAAVTIWQNQVIDIDYLENAFDESGFHDDSQRY